MRSTASSRPRAWARLPPASRPRRPAGSFKEYELGFVHLDVKHLPKLRTAGRRVRKRYLFVAIDRRSRFVHLAVKDDETEASARAFLKEALAAFPFRVTHLLTDRGSCFTADGFEKSAATQHRTSQDAALHAAHERDGRALQRPRPARGARDHGRQSSRPGAPAGRLQLGLQRPPPACPGREVTRAGLRERLAVPAPPAPRRAAGGRSGSARPRARRATR